MPRFTVRPLAWREINEQLDYLEEQDGLGTAERFLDLLISSFEDLSRMPGMGVLCGFRKPATRRLLVGIEPTTFFNAMLARAHPLGFKSNSSRLTIRIHCRQSKLAGQAQGRLGPFKGGPTGNTAGIPQKVKLEAKLQWKRVYDSWRVFGT
jgi:plasmid stabilization system protein ParE